MQYELSPEELKLLVLVRSLCDRLIPGACDSPLPADTPKSIRQLSGIANPRAHAEKVRVNIQTVYRVESGSGAAHDKTLRDLAAATLFPMRYIAAAQRARTNYLEAAQATK